MSGDEPTGATPEASGDGAPSRLEPVGDDNWEDFTRAPFSVLMIATTTCPICKKWTTELAEWLETDEQWQHVRFGKVNLNAGAVSDFKRANREWISDLPGVPFSVFFMDGKQVAELPGRGVKRLVRRLERVQSERS